MGLKKIVLSLAAAGLFCGSAFAWEASLPDTALEKSLILVDKGKKEFFYLERNGEKITRLHYPSIHGEIEGDKQFEGDLKTPEGVYFVRGKIQVPLDFEMYGNHAYALNYPNPIDRLRGKTGGGIWIHSKGDPIAGQFTQGCVAIDLANIKTLDEYLKPGTPVLIAQGIHSGFHKEKMLERAGQDGSAAASVTIAAADSALPGTASAAADLQQKTPAEGAVSQAVTALTSENNIVIVDDEAEVVSAGAGQGAAVKQENKLPAQVLLPAEDSAAAARATERGKPQNGMPQAVSEDKPVYGSTLYVPEPVEVSEDEAFVRQATLDWNRIWSERSEAFFDFYNAADYSKTTGDFEKFRHQKEGLFNTLSWIYIAIGDVEVLQGPDYFVSWFKQYYVAPNHKTEGIRRLYWTKGADGKYRVSAMEWFPQAVGLEYTLDDKIKKEVPVLIENWRLAWEQADIQSYASYYSEYALQDTRKGLEAIKEQKQAIWEVKKPKKVVFRDMVMHMEQEGLKVEMKQDYEDSAGYSDKGIKVLTLHPKGDGWVIYKESWRRL